MSTSNRPYLSFFVIEHAEHGSAALEEQHRGGQHYRFLKVTGHWSAKGTRAVPLLAWTDRQEVEAAAAIASKARDRVFKVSSLGGDSLVAEQFAAFSERHAEALLGYLPYATAAARKLEELRVRTIDCAGAVLRVHRAADAERMQVLKDEGRLLQQAHRLTVFSAAQFLTGKKADEILALLKTGELDSEEKLSIEELRAAVQLANNYERTGKLLVRLYP
ncbi:hypothetical protein EJP69_14215 [Variovorax gossypii]|uniref:Uncharacterized protein n=1 Tax=Variovorax gossypii TaxID=1679495 RepID=A0A431TP94_9BURK|nr:MULTISPECIES: hypothetical protein [Variovorax]MDR6522191.1 hypothetical protein [Variovorax paradoxus]RTQ35512.1 hypothetical protein EJP69_14215 [Variovorax gossypii]